MLRLNMLTTQRAAPLSGCSYREVDDMPTFDTLPLNEARANSAAGQRAELLQEYMVYIQRVARGQAGKLEPGEGETTQGQRGGGRTGEGIAGPPFRQLLGTGRPTPRQASNGRPRSLPPRLIGPTKHLFTDRTKFLLPNQLLSWTRRNSNQKMTYSWAVDLDGHGQGKLE